ncbi:small integral membrane protein 11 isoform X2 [Bubalus kerabau]|uniref:small integral membrane protein 11A isoform X1 n=2 Tax=Bubalus bubalis TaxID=89462 RepID=UPI000DBCB060|nr:small integral membrane protein 11A isoform X1 [Bubalus bubalis]XP_025136989.1 small integral membrane protein 11A isoform X1 [Bubalus bubalis]XP_025136996.1 small integral membrane protein 11A isoform X1 [Bubalus bubalis]XP_025137011.1 small integral membrane protein 11A isoform X1 [Bubalus bubalis]XP_044795286.1 small integral membrane protein 11A isoform X1 [Bubalus bubalis]XP_044795288.1 small integral membrane protein 11A isoform X1 [Bubalus bubalis]XP_044795291.1 small integral membr
MEAPRGESLTRVCRPFIQSSGLLTRGNSGTCPNQVPSPPCLRGPHDQEWSPSWSSMNWKVLEHFPLLLYILAAKTLILCLAFAGVKVYQRKRLEAKQQKIEAEKRKQAEKKES